MEFCNWIIQKDQLIPQILFTKNAMFTRDRIMNHRNSHPYTLENPNEKTRQIFCMNIWYGITDDRLTGMFILEHHLTTDRYLNFLEDHLENCWKMCYLRSEEVWFQQDGVLAHFTRCVRQ
jgi:hypothetical protein